MYELIFIFGLIFIMNLYYAKRIEYFSNFKSGNIVYGQEALMTDYVTASNNPVSNLPDQFTVCSSLFFNHLTTNKNVFEIYKEDGTHWFHLSFNPVRDLTTRTEILDLYSQTEFKNVQIIEMCQLLLTPGTTSAWAWTQCQGSSGYLLMEF